jgi:hypothetical protein
MEISDKEKEDRQRQSEREKAMNVHRNRFRISIDHHYNNLCWAKKGERESTSASMVFYEEACKRNFGNGDIPLNELPKDCEVGTALARIFDKVEGADKSKLPDMETEVNRMVEELFS